jgi:ligand-binding sensor domain-containing protein/signal transduction histidine kinase
VVPDPVCGQNLQFEQLTLKDGLPYDQITVLLQDKQGFLWIGTEDGLSRYDGRAIKEFRHSTKDENSLSNNIIRSLYEDSFGRIWIGTNMGLNVYSPEKNNFHRFIISDSNNNMAENFILDAMVDQLNQVWYGTYNGLYMMNQDTEEVHHFLPDSNNNFSIPDIVVWKIFEDKKGRLWMGTNNGLAIYENDGSFNFTQYLPDFHNPKGLQTDAVWAFCEQEDSTIWLGSYNGLFRVEEDNEKFSFTNYRHKPENGNSLSYNYIENLSSGLNNTIYAGTWNGGFNEIKIRKETPGFYHYKASPENTNGISHNNVTSCLLDHSGVLWVGTKGGLNRTSLAGEKFKTVFKDDRNISQGSAFHVNAILVDNDDNLWIGTRGNGLLFLTKEKFDRADYRFTVFKKENSRLTHNNIYGLFQEENGEIWVNTYNALNRIKLNKIGLPESWRYYNSDHGLHHRFTTDILKINDTLYWVATYGQLSKMTIDPDKRSKVSFINYDMHPERKDALVNATTYSLCLDRFGQLWVGTFGGLSKLVSDEDEGIFENYIYDSNVKNGIGGTQVGVLFCDSKGRMWAGSEGGLSYFVQKSAHDSVSFQTFGIESGLPNDVIKSIQEDNKGNLWLSTNRGLAVFDVDLALAGQKPVIKVYDVNDGLQGNVFSFRSSFQDKTGLLYFGGTDGFSVIDPQNITENKQPPKTVFTEFRLFNKTVFPSDSAGAILKKAINHTDTIVLSYNQNNFTIGFVALDFVKPVKNEYAYFLEGFEKDWIYSGNRNFATYTHLPPGEYIFRAKGTNNDGIWSLNPAEIVIISLPPFWKTWWAFLIYTFTFFGLTITFIRYRINVGLREVEKAKAIEVARYEEREMLRKKNAADFHDELGHNLTKISLFLELAGRQENIQSSVSKYLNKVKENTKGLADGIRDLIWTIDPKNDSLYEILSRLRDFGDQLFEFSDITFRANKIKGELKQFEINADARKHLLLLFKEAMNNTLKYSGANRARLHVLVTAHSIEIFFRDNGQGFNIHQAAKGYGLKNMAERAEKAGAVFTLSSSENNGTTVKVKLKQKSKARLTHRD